MVDFDARGMAGNASAAADLANQRIDSLPKGLVYKGAVDYYADLPSSADVGDTYTVKYSGTSGTNPLGQEYAWGSYEGTNQWIAIGVEIVLTENLDGSYDMTIL